MSAPNSPLTRGDALSEVEQPYQLHLEANHVSIVLSESVQSADWGQLETFGATVIAELEKRSRPTCLADLTGLTYMSSALVALVVRIWKGVQAGNGRMVVVCGHPLVLEVIGLAGLNRVWEIVPDTEAGYRKLGVKPPVSESEATAPSPVAKTRGVLVVGVLIVVLVLISMALVQFSDALPENLRHLMPWNNGAAGS